MTINKPLGILGGTFDPVHFGHLRMALDIYQHCDLQEVRLIPCKQPVYTSQKNDTQANSQARLAMLRLAIADTPGLTVDERELQRETPSYTIDTLLSLRAALPQTPLCFIMGSDTLATLDTWHRWQEILDIAHLIVISRPQVTLATTGRLAELLAERSTTNTTLLRQDLVGHIFRYNEYPLAISSSNIRNQIKFEQNPQFLLPERVLSYIKEHFLYVK